MKRNRINEPGGPFGARLICCHS